MILITSVDEDVEKTNSHVGGNVNWSAAVENSMVVPQKIKNRDTIWSNNSTTTYPKKTKTLIQKHTGTMFNAALFTITKIWKQPKLLSVHQ